MSTKATIEFEKFLKKIGGLENGYFEKYHGKNPIRKLLFKITAFLLYKIPYNKRPRNPFRTKIYEREYFSVGDGWLPLVQKIIEEAINKKWNKEICQVKEKFGGLRFYINDAPREVFDIISKYEDMSYKTCEVCGQPGIQRPGGWIETLCDKHYKK